MAEMVSSAIVGEAVSLIFSGIAPSSRNDDKSDEEAAGGGGLERLEMARIKMEAALETSDRWQISDRSLLHWRKKLKRAAQDCDDAARRCRRLSREEEEAELAVRQSSFPRRVAHATKSLISSLVGGDSDRRSAVSSTTVRRFERLADGAGEFMRYVQLGGTPRQNLFFDPLIGHIFAGKTVMYQVLHPGGKYHFFSIKLAGFEERGLEAMLSFTYEDREAPKNNFGLQAMLRLSESTDVIGTTVKCLQLMTPHFKAMARVAIGEITHLPTQDFSCVARMEHWKIWNHAHRTLTGWFRPDPLCCQGQGYDHDHDMVPSCHGDNGKGNKSSVFPEPVFQVLLRRYISLSKYRDMSGSTAVTGHGDTSCLDNCPRFKLGILFLPHDSLEDPKSAGCAIDVVDRANQHHLTHVNVQSDQLDKMFLPKAIDYLRRNAEAMMYKACWRSNHGSAHLCAEKRGAERILRACVATRQGRNIKSTEELRLLQLDKQVQSWKHIAGAFLKLWVVRSSERLRSSFTVWFNELGQSL
ncbi:unnamed protein product [Triticum turgidum subsp. durum]|uniref:Uncharacterized protein n=1 Tax=Triticum turgidum subsp. durum TaxID=4567 RepID=A0A9R1QTH1_TRITD|nr:unnamed protein product [Triticum turgidum subsp. durum]